MIQLITQLRLRRDELLELRANALKRLCKLKYKGDPKYHIKIDSSNDQIYVRLASDRGKGKYIQNKNHAGAKQIADYDYLTKVIKLIDIELKKIDRSIAIFQTLAPEDYYATLCPARQKLITPIIPTDDQFIEHWLAQPYEKKGFDYNDQTDFRTVKNERVRSKSEIIIANTLERKHVPYKYECPIFLNELGIIHPDFTALNVKRRKVVYWEHLGKMDDEGYARKNTFRINVYQKNGIFLGDNLIVTAETSTMPLDIRLLESLIDRYLLQ